MADRKISDLTALTAPAAGDYLPIVDISEVAAADKNKRITIEELFRSIPGGTAAAPSIAMESDPTTGLYSPAVGTVGVSTGGTERLRITAAGNVGIGTNAPSQLLHINGNALLGGSPAAQWSSVTISSDAAIQAAAPLINLVNAAGSARFGYINHTGTGGDLYFLNQEAGALRLGAGNAERARIDSSGRLLIGTSTAPGSAPTGAVLALQSSTAFGPQYRAISTSNDQYPIYFITEKARGSSIVQVNDQIAHFAFRGYDGTQYLNAATIYCEIDGTPGTNDMPGRLVFSTTADGASSPTEQWRISNGGTVIYNQPAPAAVDVTATLTVANLTAKIITSTTAAAVTMTLPTGTLMDGGFSGLYTNMAFEWTVINTGGTNAVTVQAGASHTLVGSGTVAANGSGRFVSRRTAATTWVTYRLAT